jgi:hypothetical protein
MQPVELFISHSSADQRFVDELVSVLQRHGIPVWYSHMNVLGAQQWHDEIGNALARCDWILVVLSPNSVDSMWVKREVKYALEQKRLDDRIIPVVFEPCDHRRLSWVLSSFQMVSFQHGFEGGCRQLLRLWGLAYTPSLP